MTEFESDRRLRRQVDQIDPRRLADERDRSTAPRIDLEHENFSVGDHELNVEQALDVESARQRLSVVRLVDRQRRKHRYAVARMNARSLDVLHDPADQYVVAVAHRINVKLRPGQISINEHGVLAVRRRDRSLDIRRQLLVVVHDLHRSTAQHITRSHHQRITDPIRRVERLLDREDRRAFRSGNVKPLAQIIKRVSILRAVDVFDRRSQYEIAILAVDLSVERPRPN